MKLLKVKKQDAKPSIRIKAAGNVFVEVYKDNKGYFYRIDVPGATDFVSKERFENQDKARLAGVTHAKKFIGKVRGDQKKTDMDFRRLQSLVGTLSAKVGDCAMGFSTIMQEAEKMDLHEAEDILEDIHDRGIENNLKICMKNFDKMVKALEAAG